MTGTAADGERSAMLRALQLARTPGVPPGPNPRVGCVLLDPSGAPVAEGYHRGAGTPHAEVDALRAAGDRARGGTAVVTLEPCNHTGRTGPCTKALLEAGLRRVVFAQTEASPQAAGGADALRAAGLEVQGGLLAEEARQLNPAWTFAVEHRRPYVTWKFAATLDGRSAAADGTSRWISSVAARRDTHLLRRRCDTVLAGTGTVLTDDPELSARDEDDRPLPADRQPLRAVMGLRKVPAGRRVRNEVAETVLLDTRDPADALARLFALGRRHVLLEGGPRLAAAFMSAGYVDEVIAYVAPLLLGSGPTSVADLGIGTLADACRLAVVDVTTLGEGADRNVRLTLTAAEEG